MNDLSAMSPIEIAGFVAEHLREQGIEVVLSGGACVAYYTDGKYVSNDLDLVNVAFARRSRVAAAMRAIGFVEQGRHFVHPCTDYFVEFPPGPLSIGDEQIGEAVQVQTRVGSVRVLSPTDCVKDRLAGFYHWSDLPSLKQAILVAKDNEIDLEQVQRWSRDEGKSEGFDLFLRELKKRT